MRTYCFSLLFNLVSGMRHAAWDSRFWADRQVLHADEHAIVSSFTIQNNERKRRGSLWEPKRQSQIGRCLVSAWVHTSLLGANYIFARNCWDKYTSVYTLYSYRYRHLALFVSPTSVERAPSLCFATDSSRERKLQCSAYLYDWVEGVHTLEKRVDPLVHLLAYSTFW